MSTPKLTYAILEKLADAKAGHHLDLTQVSVARFGDDKSAIELGATVPFVARFALTATPAAIELLRSLHIKVIPVGGLVLGVNASGELESDLDVEIAADVPKWIADHYAFGFAVRGVDRSAFRPYRLSRVDEDDYPSFYPWIQEITTHAVRGELIDVEVDIEPRDPPVSARKRSVLTRSPVPVQLDQALVHLAFEVHGNYQSPASLANGEYWITLHSDHRPDLKLKLAVHDVSIEPAEPPVPDGLLDDRPYAKQVRAGKNQRTD